MAKGRESKPHIGIFGRRNNGKSSFINALAGQDIAIVSDVPGTTTDPVRKSMEISGIGPAILVDTAGIDDTGELGAKRVSRSLSALRTVDLAILVITSNTFHEYEEKLVKAFRDHDVPFVVIHNKSDVIPLNGSLKQRLESEFGALTIDFCSLHPENVEEVIAALRQTMPETAYSSNSLLGDLLSYADRVLILESCTHHVSCDDIGRMKIPRWMSNYTGKKLEFDVVAGLGDTPRPVKEYALVVQCGGCVITRKQVVGRLKAAVDAGVPVTNYGMAIAWMHGIYQRAVAPFTKVEKAGEDYL